VLDRANVLMGLVVGIALGARDGGFPWLVILGRELTGWTVTAFEHIAVLGNALAQFPRA
jgi:hypothetical protein